MKTIRGAGGGGKGGKAPRQPVEQPDSLKSRSFAKVIDLLSEGEVYGPMNGTLERSIYLDGTPLQNADGTFNFQDVIVDHRPGTQDQEHIPGFPSIESSIAVGVELTAGSPWTRFISNVQLSAVRIMIATPTLMQVDEETGDRNGYYVGYHIYLSTDGGPYELVLNSAFNGKNTTGYSRTHRIDLPPATTGWTVRVLRVTPNSTETTIQDTTVIESITEVIDAKLRFPNSALVGLQVNAEQFSSIPTRAYLWGGLYVRMPSNYNPITREYSGTWDGQFVRGFTNNPAWVFYDLVIEDRYGLGNMVDASMLDRYFLYNIAQYCDQLVSDGQGGQEPRFTANVYLQKEGEALKVLQDFAAIFRGMVYWAGGSVFTVADMPSDPVYMYTNAKVKDGRFEYTGTPRHQRKTVALVSWVDPNDFSRAKVEPVENEEGLRRYGVQKINVAPLGCTSRSQAQRIGNYILLTSLMETGGVGFSVGLDGVIPNPGQIIRIADKHRAGRQLGGLISAATSNTITLDRDSQIAPGGQLSVILPDGTLEQRTVLSLVGRVVTVTLPFSQVPTIQGQWLIDAEDLVAQYFKVISVRETGGIEFQVQAVVHHPGKYSAIDNGTRLEPLPVTVIPSRVQVPPTNVTITGFTVLSQGISRANATIQWQAAEGAVQYEIEWRRNSNEWARLPRTGSLSVELQDIFAGDYEARVRALNSFDIPSNWAYAPVTPLDGLVGEPPPLTTLTTTGQVMAIKLDWGYPGGRNIFERVQIRASLTNQFSASYLLVDLAYPANTYTLFGLGYSTEMWFWGRLIDKNGQAGPWYPSESGPGVYGQPDQDPQNILDYLEGQIGAGQLAPGLIEEITEGVAEEIADIVELVDTVAAGLVEETYQRTANDEALAGSIAAQAARVDTNIAAIMTEAETRATADSAMAGQITNLAAQVGTAEANAEEALEVAADLDGSLRATWQIRTQVRSDGRVVQAGVALGAAIGENGVARSEFLVRADTVAFLNSLNGVIHVPFVFDTVNDTAFLANAYIQNLSVDTIKIANGAVTTMVAVNQAFGALGNIPANVETQIIGQSILSQGQPVYINVSASSTAPPFWGGPNAGVAQLYLYRGNTLLRRQAFSNPPAPILFVDQPPAGFNSYYVYVLHSSPFAFPSPAVDLAIFQWKK